MKSLTRMLLLLFITAALVTSCKKGAPKQTKHIPKNAVFVATINTKSIKSKLMKSQATLENIIKSVAGDDTAGSKSEQEWKDLKEAGVDLDDNFYLAFVQKGEGLNGREGTGVTTGFGTLNDEKKLEGFIKKKQPEGGIKKEKNYSYTVFQGDKIVAWRDDLVIMMSYQKNVNDQVQYDSESRSFNFKNPVNAENEMKMEMEAYFNLKEEGSVAAIPEFRELLQEKSDGNFWINASGSLDNIALPLPRLKELMTNCFTAATVNFEDGRIAVNSKSYFSNELKDVLKKYTGATADVTAIENYPSDNINGFIAFAFNPEFFQGLVNFMEVGAIVDSYLTKMMGSNFTLTDAVKTVKGDFSLVVSDFRKEPGMSIGNNILALVAPAKMIADIPIGDKTQMNRVMDKLVENQMMVKTPQGYRLNELMRKLGFAVVADDKNLLIAKDEALLNGYKSKATKAKLPDEIINDFKGKSGVMYVNIESILNGFPMQNKQNDSTLIKAKGTFKDIKGYLKNFNGKIIEGHYELRFKDEKLNSLTSLLAFMETASKNKSIRSFNASEEDSIPMALPNLGE